MNVRELIRAFAQEVNRFTQVELFCPSEYVEDLNNHKLDRRINRSHIRAAVHAALRLLNECLLRNEEPVFPVERVSDIPWLAQMMCRKVASSFAIEQPSVADWSNHQPLRALLSMTADAFIRSLVAEKQSTKRKRSSRKTEDGDASPRLTQNDEMHERTARLCLWLHQPDLFEDIANALRRQKNDVERATFLRFVFQCLGGWREPPTRNAVERILLVAASPKRRPSVN